MLDRTRSSREQRAWLTVKAVDQASGAESAPVEIQLEAIDDMCATGSEGEREAAAVVPSCQD
jgi:hypothetical protein